MEASLSAARALTARTVHIKLYPTPRTFPERREVLRVLERFGEVKMFRSLKYNRKHQTPVHNAFRALFASQSSVTDLINASPLRYRLVAETSPPTSSSSSPEAPTEQQEEQGTTFSLNASPTTFNHNEYLSGSTNPLHGPFRPIPPKYSYIGSSLERIVPESLWSKGLIDWETDKGEDLQNGREDGARISTAGEAGDRNAAGLQRVHIRLQNEAKIPDVMYGLRRLVEQREGSRREGGREMAEDPAMETSRGQSTGSKTKETKWDEMMRTSEQRNKDTNRNTEHVDLW
ncbi:uncharacterized protein PAC_17609 [Phialocephala subalpina]|uniref:Uncharacterized protein n=1 Tax=Phialocephala subalpina TaxID=576137 RepID=A0A1L7XRQ0_9HELO|nr:uncharacterized protein PAC_17609 [Phialocephala subalpina]